MDPQGPMLCNTVSMSKWDSSAWFGDAWVEVEFGVLGDAEITPSLNLSPPSVVTVPGPWPGVLKPSARPSFHCRNPYGAFGPERPASQTSLQHP